MTLHIHKVDDHAILNDDIHGVGNGHIEPLPVPAGWQIADGNADDVRVCGAHPWQSHCLVFANGDAYGTAAVPVTSLQGAADCGGDRKKLNFASRVKTGKKASDKWLKKSAQGVSAQKDGYMSGSYDVLLRRRA
jgi:hypothetical protein